MPVLKGKEDCLALSFKVALLRDRKKPGLWLVTWKSDVEIKIPAMFFPQIESEHLQQNYKWLLQQYRVLGIKSAFLFSFS